MHLRILLHRNAVLLYGITGGLFFPQAAPLLKHAVIYLLGTILTLSFATLSGRRIRSSLMDLRRTLLAFCLNTLLLGGLLLLAGLLFAGHPHLAAGFVLLGVMPPAIAILPFSHMLGGDDEFCVTSVVSGYLLALLVMPLGLPLLLSAASPPMIRLGSTILLLILLPLLLSRMLRSTALDRRIAPFRGTLTNWGFCLIIYAMVGANSADLLRNPVELIPLFTACLCVTWLAGLTLAFFSRPYGRRRAISIALVGTMKNSGMAGGLALALFAPQAALAPAVYTICMITFVVVLDLVVNSWRPSMKKEQT